MSNHSNDITVVFSISVDKGPMDHDKTILYAGARDHCEPGYYIYRPKGGTACLDAFICDGSDHRIWCWFELPGFNDGNPHLIILEFDRDDRARMFMDNKECPTSYDISKQPGYIDNSGPYQFMNDDDPNRVPVGKCYGFFRMDRLISLSEKDNLYWQHKHRGVAQ